MIEKIISNGQAGAAITALDMAIKLGLDHGGWCREGQGIADRYQLERVPGTAYRSITERCVGESEGSLFFSKTENISLALESLKKTALRQNKPFLIHNLVGESGFSSSRKIAAWITDNHIKVLHVDGEADDLDARLSSGNIAKILEATFFLTMVDTGITSPLQSVVRQSRFSQPDAPPETIEAAPEKGEASTPAPPPPESKPAEEPKEEAEALEAAYSNVRLLKMIKAGGVEAERAS